MHSLEFTDGVAVHYNGDFSGDVRLTLPSAWIGAEPVFSSDDVEMAEISIPFNILRNLVIEYFRSRAIANLEDMSYKDWEEYLSTGFPTNED